MFFVGIRGNSPTAPIQPTARTTWVGRTGG